MRNIVVVVVLATIATVALARPEPPIASSYFPSSSDSQGGGYPAPVYGQPAQQPVIHKHVYVHVPPPEAPEYKAPKYVAPAPPPQKHYKIVFIKAPTPPTPTAPAIPALPQPDEEKTLIYVLVKKPEEAPEIQLPTQAPTQPSKPEVYFIRYKTQKEQSGAYGPPNANPGTPIDNYGPPSANDGPYKKK
ncbi:repetitive proline-rich cell wall protein [Trichogramma pretiosum]|uniref:repetitive proline-rich cell wall protein n=1 Tax=Trichogramma pretiosum TaxID=7493 RepID=UPI0006C9D7B9|nr:repetitive proline-rich cell wall protein [Trichogramma pretiosum]